MSVLHYLVQLCNVHAIRFLSFKSFFSERCHIFTIVYELFNDTDGCFSYRLWEVNTHIQTHRHIYIQIQTHFHRRTDNHVLIQMRIYFAVWKCRLMWRVVLLAFLNSFDFLHIQEPLRLVSVSIYLYL